MMPEEEWTWRKLRKHSARPSCKRASQRADITYFDGIYLSLTICTKTGFMAKIGNNPNRNAKKPSLKDYNDAWAQVRKRAVQRTINLNAQLNQAFQQINTGVAQQQASNALRGSNISAASAMSRLNILV